MRIIAGKHKKRAIDAPKGNAVRPTSDFVREAVFNLLTHSKLTEDDPLTNANVLDCFAGSGALGLEALSRGAGHVTFLDKSRESLTCARKNAERFGELANCDFLSQELPYLQNAPKRFNLVFLDPPYGSGLLKPALKNLFNQDWLVPGALIVVEHDEAEHFASPEGFTLLQSRKYGRTIIAFLQAS